MATGTGFPSFCLKHNPKWRNKFQEFLNKISGPTRRNPLICESDVKRITKAVCPCEKGPNQAWSSITPDRIKECHDIYTHSPAYEGSKHKEFYEKVKQLNLFTGHGNGSADRLIYILSNKLLPVGHERDDILERICPIKQRPPGDPIHIGSLKEAHTGRFFGRGGTGIREAVHGIPVGNITIDIRQIQNSDMVEARATFSCRPRHIQQVLEGLRQRVGYYENVQPVPLREKVVLHLPGFRLAFCVPMAGEGSQLRSAVIGCKGARQQHGRGGHQSMDM